MIIISGKSRLTINTLHCCGSILQTSIPKQINIVISNTFKGKVVTSQGVKHVQETSVNLFFLGGNLFPASFFILPHSLMNLSGKVRKTIFGGQGANRTIKENFLLLILLVRCCCKFSTSSHDFVVQKQQPFIFSLESNHLISVIFRWLLNRSVLDKQQLSQQM